MIKRFMSPLFAIVGFSYLCVRLGMQLAAGSYMSWIVFAFEVSVLTELGLITYFKSTSKRRSFTKAKTQVSGATAILDARSCDLSMLTTSLYALEESREFSEVFVLVDKQSKENLESIDPIIKQFSKVNILNHSNIELAGSKIAWINPGDVVLGDMLTQAQNEMMNETAIAIPASAIWSNEINNSNLLIENDEVSASVNSYITEKNSAIWAGETCIFSTDFYNSIVSTQLHNSDMIKIVNEFATSSNQKIQNLKIIGLETQNIGSPARTMNRSNEIRTGLSMLTSKATFKSHFFAATRFAIRPLRAMRTVAVVLIASVAVIMGHTPYPGENTWVLLTSLGVIALAFLSTKLFLYGRIDDNTRIRNNFSNLGTDLISPFSKNSKTMSFINTFAAPSLTVIVAMSLVIRWILNIGDDVGSQNSAPAILWGMAALGTLIYGLELVSFRQRRSDLRRIVNLNAKFGTQSLEIADLSQKDCGAISKLPLEIGTEEKITLTIPDSGTISTIVINAKVVNVSKTGISYRIGFVFMSLSKENAEILKRFCTLTYPQFALRGFAKIPGETPTSDVGISKKRTTGKLTSLRNQTKKPLVRVAAMIALFAVAAGNLPPYSSASATTAPGAASVIAGTTYQDFNANGVKDAGNVGSATDTVLSGIQVLATCDNKGSFTTGTATTNSLGQFVINNVLGQCRVEVVGGIPNGMQPAAVGRDSASTVQFHKSGTSNIMYGFQYPGEYCQNNPNVVTTCFGRGNVATAKADKGSIVSNTWNSSSRWSDVSKFGKTGTVYGLAYNSDSKELFSSAYLRRKAGLGPLGIGGIYKTSLGVKGEPVSQWLDLEKTAASFGETLGANPRAKNQTNADLAANDAITEQYVGRRGIGDIDISPDNKTLYATNLNTGSIYAIDIKNPSVAKRFVIPGTATTSSGRNCSRAANANDFRIFGLGVKGNGDVFVGAVCTAQSTQNRSDLYMYVYKFNPSTQVTPVQVSKSGLNFDRDKASSPWQSRAAGTPTPDLNKYHGTTIRWEPWQAKQQSRFVKTKTEVYPYPSVSDITFDGNDLVVGMRDIYSDTMPPDGVPKAGEFYFWGVASGDIVRLCGTSATSYVLESNRSCPDGRKATGTKPTSGFSDLGKLATGKDQHLTNGPGGGEWFTGDDPWDQWGEGALGAIAKPGGFNTFVATQSDPAIYDFVGRKVSTFSAGTRWFDAASGNSSKGNTVYDPSQQDFTFSKSGGLGDLEALCDQAPIQIGNRVWLDSNNNGIQDPAETGLENVKVDLLDSKGIVLKSTTTNPSGQYSFSDLKRDTEFSVRINYTNTPGVQPSKANAGTSDSIDSDGIVSGNYVSAKIGKHIAGQNDHNVDFGFKPVFAIGNQVFNDKNNNGLKDSGEAGIKDIPVRLLNANKSFTGKSTTTEANGKYYFQNLDAGSYIVEIMPPAGYISSTGNIGKLSGPSEPAPSPDTEATKKIDNDDNGTSSELVILSKPLTVGLGKAPVGEGDGATKFAPDDRNDFTVDFGIFQELRIGDKVFTDTNANGVYDNPVGATGDQREYGLAGVDVTLYANACGTKGVALATTTTGEYGIYAFGALNPGDYYVAFQLPNGYKFTKRYIGNIEDDSNADVKTGCSDKITLTEITTPGLSVPGDSTIDAGLVMESDPIDLAITKNVTNIPGENKAFNPGDVVNYELKIKNNGPGTAQTGYVVSDTLPSGLTFQGGATSSGYSCLIAGQNLSCTSNHTLSKSVTDTISYKAKVENTFQVAASKLGNIAKVTPNPKDVTETAPLNNCSATGEAINGSSVCNNIVTNNIALPTDLKVLKSIDASTNPNYAPGTNVDYIISISNNGPAQAKTGFKIEDSLSGDLSFVSASGSGYTCSESGQKVTCTSGHPLGINTIETIRIRVKVKATLTASGQSIKNTVSISPSPTETYIESTPLDKCNDDGSNKDVCNNRDSISFSVPSGASIGDSVFYDLDHDGIQGPSEVGIGGITVELHENTCASATIKTTTTSSDGKYIFTNLIADKTYVIKFITKDGMEFTKQNIGDDNLDSDAGNDGCTEAIVLTPGLLNQSIDAGLFKPWSATGDFVWNDLNKNGIQDQGEPGIEGVTVSLRNSTGAVIATKTTDNKGWFIFNNIEPGQYSLVFVTPNGYTIAPKGAGSNIAKDSDISSDGTTRLFTLSPNANDSANDAGYFVSSSSIGNSVWSDTNGNGIQDSNETGISGLKVYLYGPQCGVGSPLKETTTDASGNFLFTDLASGSYTVKFTKPTGSSFTRTNVVGADETKDSDADSDGCSPLVVLTSGIDNLNIDAGIVTTSQAKASIGDRVWFDWNRNGIQDTSEDAGVPDIIVTLLDSDGNVVQGMDAVTDKDGFYQFTGITPGTYSVRFEPSSIYVNFQFTKQNAAGDTSKDSDADPTTGKSKQFTLASGEENKSLDAGIVSLPSTIGDFVWNDLNQNGIQDEGEPGLAGVQVNLYECDFDYNIDATAEPIQSVVSDENGKYTFTDIEMSVVAVQFITSDDLKPTIQWVDEGAIFETDTDIGNDSDIGIDGFSNCVTLYPGTPNDSIDAGFFNPDEPPVKVLPNVITRGDSGSQANGTLPFTGGQASQLLAFALSFIGAGVMLAGFFTQRKKKLSFF